MSQMDWDITVVGIFHKILMEICGLLVMVEVSVNLTVKSLVFSPLNKVYFLIRQGKFFLIKTKCMLEQSRAFR